MLPFAVLSVSWLHLGLGLGIDVQNTGTTTSGSQQ